jgi:glutaredoxin
MRLPLVDVEKVLPYRVYSKKGCIFCDAAMDLMEKHEIKYEEIKIDGNETALRFLKQHGFKTVPQIYDERGKHIGGYQDFRTLVEWPENPAECHSL